METEQKSLYPDNKQQQFKLNLKHLPPIDPSITKVKNEKPNYREYKLKVEEYASFYSTKYIDPNCTTNRAIHNKWSESDTGCHQIESINEGDPNKASAKSQLHDICAANNWKSPLFECCKEEGPNHMKLFTFKVTFVIESSNTILECFGAPQPRKKTAAEHAAEGALWYLKFLGYFPIKRKKKNDGFA